MSMSDYLRQVREKIGNHLLVLPSAAVALFDEQGRVLLGKHSDRNIWVMPGGLIEPAESPADGAARETFEETGLIVELTGILGVFGGTDLIVHYKNGDVASYVAIIFRGKIKGGTERPDGQEILDLRYFSQQELSGVPHSKWMDPVMSSIFSPLAEPYFHPPTWKP